MSTSTAVFLLLYAGLSAGVVCVIDVQMYAVTETAEHTYGTLMGVHTARTFIGCCSLCSKDTGCKSVLYHVASSECRTNDALVSSASLPPSDGWKYAEIPSSTQTTVAPIATLATPCSTNGDCSIANTKCGTSTGLCQCVAGHSFDSGLGQCVTGCSSYGTTFQTDLGKGFAGYGDVNLSGATTLEECKAACITETSVTCVVAEHKPGSLSCQLYTGTALTLSAYGSYSTVNLYQRDCA